MFFFYIQLFSPWSLYVVFVNKLSFVIKIIMFFLCVISVPLIERFLSHPSPTLIPFWSSEIHLFPSDQSGNTNHYIALISTALQHARLPISLFKGFTKTYFISQSNVTFSWQHGTVHTAEFTMITPFLQCLPQDL